MAQDLHRDAGRDTLREQKSGSGVAGVVQPGGAHAGIAEQLPPAAMVVARIDRLAGQGREHEPRVLPHRPGGQATAANSTGASTFEFLAAAGWDTGSHRHSTIEEQFYVIEGEMELRAGERTVTGGAGTFVSVPRGVAHAFANRRDTPARMLLICTPPGHERYFAELAAILRREGAPDPDEIASLRARYDTIQVSPLSA